MTSWSTYSIAGSINTETALRHKPSGTVGHSAFSRLTEANVKALAATAPPMPKAGDHRHPCTDLIMIRALLPQVSITDVLVTSLWSYVSKVPGHCSMLKMSTSL